MPIEITENTKPESRYRMPGPFPGPANWPRSLVLWASIAAAGFLCFWYAFEILLLAFAGTLLAIVLYFCTDWIRRHTPKPIGRKLSYLATILGLLVLVGLTAYFIVPHAIAEAGKVADILPSSMSRVMDYLNSKEWGKYIVRAAQRASRGSAVGPQVRTVTDDLATVVEGAVVILVVGFYGALNAREYSRGLLALIPRRNQQRVSDVCAQVVHTLGWWVLGQFVPMAVLGVATMIGLWALGVPLAFALGLLTGLMIFIPYIGSWIAYIPTVLVSLTRGPDTAIYVTILYLVLHGVEGYLLTPLVQKRAVLLPPVLTILSQFFMWNVSGLLGVALATPLAATALVLVKMLYLQEDLDNSTADA